MPNLFCRILLFASSYFPLAIICALRAAPHGWYWAAGLFALAFGSLVGLYVYIRLARRLGQVSTVVTAAKNEDAETMSYIVTYAIPFLDVAFEDWSKSVSLVVFAVTVGIIYVNTGMIHINPMLNLAGYHILSVESEGRSRTLITKTKHLPKGTEIRVHRLGEDLLLEALR